MAQEQYKDPEWLREKYHDEGLSSYGMAACCGVSYPDTTLFFEDESRQSARTTTTGRLFKSTKPP